MRSEARSLPGGGPLIRQFGWVVASRPRVRGGGKGGGGLQIVCSAGQFNLQIIDTAQVDRR